LRVVLVEPERERLAIEDLLLDTRFEHVPHLLAGRRMAMKDRHCLPHALHFLVADHDPVRIGVIRLAAPDVQQENEPAEQEEMNEWILEQSQHRNNLPRKKPSVQQPQPSGYRNEGRTSDRLGRTRSNTLAVLSEKINNG
jgi:hypothetical protein